MAGRPPMTSTDWLATRRSMPLGAVPQKLRRWGSALLPSRRRARLERRAALARTIWIAPGAGPVLAQPLHAMANPLLLASAGAPRGLVVRLVGRPLWAGLAGSGTVFRLLAEVPDGNGRGVQVEGRAPGFPFGRREPLAVPGHSVAVDGPLEQHEDLDRRGSYIRLVIQARRVDRRPQPTTAITPGARLRQAFEYCYSYHAREPRL